MSRLTKKDAGCHAWKTSTWRHEALPTSQGGDDDRHTARERRRTEDDHRRTRKTEGRRENTETPHHNTPQHKTTKKKTNKAQQQIITLDVWPSLALTQLPCAVRVLLPQEGDTA